MPSTATATIPHFDTLAAARTIEAAGIDRNAAEAIAKVTATAQLDRDNLATKADLEPLATKADLNFAIVEVKADLRWMKIIGSTVVVLLVIPLLSDLLSALPQTPL